MDSFAKTKDAHPSIRRISVVFSGLKKKRAQADYEIPKSLFNRNETLVEIENAREAIGFIAVLDEDARRRLAIELLLPASKRDT